jgi:hypothetical protein
MRISKLAKSRLKYLPILVVLAAITIGLFLGKDLYPPSLDSQPKTLTQLPTEPNNSQPPIILRTIDPCVAIYLTQPPKCKTLEGKFIPLPGTTPYIIVTPNGN